MKRLLAAGAALLLVGCDLHPNRSEHVELILNPPPPGPNTTFELRFDQPMVEPGKIGHPAETSPLVIKPDVGGVFTWLSQRSGVFLPSEPLALDHRYELSLRAGLPGADGRPSPAVLRQRVQTPPLSVVYSTPRPEPGRAEFGTRRGARFQRARSRRRFDAVCRVPRRQGRTPVG